MAISFQCESIHQPLITVFKQGRKFFEDGESWYDWKIIPAMEMTDRVFYKLDMEELYSLPGGVFASSPTYKVRRDGTILVKQYGGYDI